MTIKIIIVLKFNLYINKWAKENQNTNKKPEKHQLNFFMRNTCCLLKKKIFDYFSIVFFFFWEFSHRQLVCNLNWKLQVKKSNNKNFNSNFDFSVVHLLCNADYKERKPPKQNHISNWVGLCQNMSIICFNASKWGTSFNDAGQTNPKSIDWLCATHMLVVFVFCLPFLFNFLFVFTSKTKSIFKNYELLTIHRNPLKLSAYEKLKLNHRFLVKSNALKWFIKKNVPIKTIFIKYFLIFYVKF